MLGNSLTVIVKLATGFGRVINNVSSSRFEAAQIVQWRRINQSLRLTVVELDGTLSRFEETKQRATVTITPDAAGRRNAS